MDLDAYMNDLRTRMARAEARLDALENQRPSEPEPEQPPAPQPEAPPVEEPPVETHDVSVEEAPTADTDPAA